MRYSHQLQSEVHELFSRIHGNPKDLTGLARKAGVTLPQLSGIRRGHKPLRIGSTTYKGLLTVAPEYRAELDSLAAKFVREDEIYAEMFSRQVGELTAPVDTDVEDSDAELIADVLRHLAIARGADNRDECFDALERGMQLVRESPSPSPQLQIANAYLLRESAYEAITATSRTTLWRNCLAGLQAVAAKVDNDVDVVLALASLTVDAVQDSSTTIVRDEKQKALRGAKKYLTRTLDDSELPDHIRSLLLTRKASVMRHGLTFANRDKDLRRSSAQEAIRCAEAALRHEEHSGARLELGMCRWAAARWTRKRAHRDDLVAGAETALKASTMLDEGALALPMFYRYLNRSDDACLAFPYRLKNHRRGLRQAWILGEAAVQADYAQPGAPEVVPWLQRAESLIEEALAAGVVSARLIVANACVKARLSNGAAGETALEDLRLDGDRLDWSQVLEFVTKEHPDDPEADLFALGLNEPALLTRLATFEWNERHNPTLAERLYRAAVKAEGGTRNAVALTNLARFLIEERQDPDSLVEAERWLQRAQNAADCLFSWWREVGHQLKAAKGDD